MIKLREPSRKQIAIACLSSLCLLLLAAGADAFFHSAPEKAAEAATPSDASAEEPKKNYRYADLSSKLTEIVEEKPYEAAPDVLNLAYYYPDDADTSDVIHSYAGRLYTELTTKEAQYMAALYDLSERDPVSMASELGLPTAQVMGRYNPDDGTHDPNNPATWMLHSFKNANIAFYDGDGNRINSYSVVKEIMSLASVYSYYHGMYDYESMRDYAMKLWERSHSYKITMGSVYYDSGCLHRTIAEEADEAIAQEAQQLRLEESLAGRTALSSGEQPVSYAAQTGGSAENAQADAADSQEATLGFWLTGETDGSEKGLSDASSGAPAEETEEGGTVQSGTENGGASNGSLFGGTEAGETESAAVERTPASVEASVPETAAAETTVAVPAEGQTQTGAQAEQGAEATFAAFGGISGAEGLSYQGVLLADAAQATLFGGSAEKEETTSQTPETVSQTEPATSHAATSSGETETGTSAGNVPARPGAAEESGDAEQEATLASSETAGAGSSLSEKNECPGHIDLYITVTIYGIDDVNGLIRRDTVGNDVSQFNDQWQGWTDEMRAYANAINAEDWFKRYGLTISAINVTNPLTEGEIEAYLKRLPDTVSETRRAIVEFALHSVGKVPYYWGGKPSAPQYEGNRFGALVAADTKGRVLRGLDCSGWINWVYWSVLGARLPGESTGTLIGCGERIGRAELQPGDIIVRTGADAHVVMFLEWAGNGNMIVIHETAGVTNNVTVSEMTANWPYYRRLTE